MTKKDFSIAVFPGDGIGKEITKQALKVLNFLNEKINIDLRLNEGNVGGAAYDIHGTPLPPESLDMALKSDAVLLGAVGGPKWESLDYALRPERALLSLRKKLGLFANLRPVAAFEELLHTSTLKEEILRGVNIMIVRELTGDVYFGQPRGVSKETNGQSTGVNTMIYTDDEIRRIAHHAFKIAGSRKKNLVSVDKANVLESTELWRDVVTKVGENYPDVNLSHMYVDNCAMQLIRNPAQFDVILTTNLFGDILSDEAAMLTGSIGMLPSASLGDNHAMYEPIHGSAPDIAGKNIANPIGTILSVAMMLRYSMNLPDEATLIEKAVQQTLKDGLRTKDIYQSGDKLVGTQELGDHIVKNLRKFFN
jgi:3-isopropylmalate dehydrogenase